MKLKYVLVTLLFIVLKTFSQESKNVLFTIDNEPFYTQEFLTVYKKNLNIVDNSKTDIQKYLQLFINYKLKVKEAKSLGLDTIQKFKNELKKYKETLILPYLKDKNVTKKLVIEAYNRLKKEINVSHILIPLKPSALPKDTIEVYNTLIEARNLIIEGNDFAKIARQYSKDPTVQQNGGEIGFFTALQMVYPFENKAFSTPVGQVSMPFKTKFGYHILKVNAIRDSRGEVEVAHIMFRKNNANAKKLIDSVYNELLNNNNVTFAEIAKKLSEDRTSGVKGGKLNKFGSGKMIEDFANVAFAIKNEGDISKPFQTQFGWHIIKLLKKYPLKNFEELKDKLTKEVEKDERSNLIDKSVIKKLFEQYNIIVNNKALQQFEIDDWKTNSEKFQQIILSINEKNISQQKFINYLKSYIFMSPNEAFKNFKEKEVLNYYKEHIELSNPDFANTYKEFKEGLLIFDLLDKQVWEKAKDNAGLLSYFNLNKSTKYNHKRLSKIKSTVISDYQNYLEITMINKLHKKYEVKINKSEKKRLKKLNF